MNEQNLELGVGCQRCGAGPRQRCHTGDHVTELIGSHRERLNAVCEEIIRGVLVEIVAVHDPNTGTDVRVYVDGHEPDLYNVYDVDAGRGYTAREWEEHTTWIRQQASPAALAFLTDHLDTPPGGEFITGGL